MISFPCKGEVEDDDDDDCVFLGERKIMLGEGSQQKVPPLVVKRPRGKQIVFVEESSTDSEGESC